MVRLTPVYSNRIKPSGSPEGRSHENCLFSTKEGCQIPACWLCQGKFLLSSSDGVPCGGGSPHLCQHDLQLSCAQALKLKASAGEWGKSSCSLKHSIMRVQSTLQYNREPQQLERRAEPSLQLRMCVILLPAQAAAKTAPAVETALLSLVYHFWLLPFLDQHAWSAICDG